MTDYKYNLPVYRIDEDGDLTFLFRYNTNYLPEVNDLIVDYEIVYMERDEDGNFIRRLYLRVVERLYPTLCGDKGVINHVEKEQIHLQVKLEVDEPVLNMK